LWGRGPPKGEAATERERSKGLVLRPGAQNYSEERWKRYRRGAEGAAATGTPDQKQRKRTTSVCGQVGKN